MSTIINISSNEKCKRPVLNARIEPETVITGGQKLMYVSVGKTRLLIKPWNPLVTRT